MNPSIVMLTFGVLGALAFIWARWRPTPADEVQHFRCPGCGQKLRYLARKGGRPGACPNCRKQWTLPAVTQKRSANEGIAAGANRLMWSARRLAS
jgi:predicted RNA-binding Zn-ribbon protein involved in translation (DUF1610 family)